MNLTDTYPVTQELSIPAEANPRFQDLAGKRELDRGYRVIGGDKGDLHFKGFTVEDGRTVLYEPELVSGCIALTPDEVLDIANEILMASFESIGVECVEHS